MKCNKCENEAILCCQSTTNDKKNEYYFCEDCARAEGFGELLDALINLTNNNLKKKEPFDEFLGDFFENFVAPLAIDFFDQLMFSSAITKTHSSTQEKVPKCECGNSRKIPKDAGNEFHKKRELNMLKSQLKTAINAENFEKAAELRDMIYSMEK